MSCSQPKPLVARPVYLFVHIAFLLGSEMKTHLSHLEYGDSLGLSLSPNLASTMMMSNSSHLFPSLKLIPLRAI